MDWEKITARLNEFLAKGKHNELRGALMMLNSVDIAEYMKSLKGEQLVMVFRILPKDISADVFAYMDDDARKALIESIGDGEIRALISDMFLDDAVDFLEEMPANVVKRILQNADPHTREALNQLLKYPENSAGSIMTIEYCEFHAGTTARQALDEVKRTGIDKETIYTLYVIDRGRHLLGTVALRKLILAADDAPVETLMDVSACVSVKTLDDQETVADTVRKYDLLSIPVVDNENRLVGIITADDIMDVIEEENTEDFEKMAALLPSDGEYLKTSAVQMAIKRMPWLIVLMFSAILTGSIILHFETLLAGAVGLTAFIPMLMDTGGNCGAQASTLVIRGLALNQVQFRDFFKVLWKEFRVSLMVGFVLAGLTFLRLLFFSEWEVGVAAVVAISLYCTVILSKAIGCSLPLLAKKVHLDPALMASPLITTIVDMCSLMIFFSIASHYLL